MINFKKSWLTLILLIIFLLVIYQSVLACVGAKPLSMGGGSIAIIKNGVNNIYWNPAGLTFLENNQFTYTRTLNNRDSFNYDDFIGYANRDLLPECTLGLGVIKKHTLDKTLGNEGVYRYDTWYVMSLGKILKDNLSIGGNVRLVDSQLKKGGNSYGSDQNITFDLAAYYSITDQFKLGLLIQDLTRPVTDFSYKGVKYRSVMNVRPGLSFQHGDSITIGVSFYDLFEELGEELDNRLMAGLEYRINNNLSLRIGSYLGHATMGAGYKINNYQFDYLYLGDEYKTHQFGVTITY